MDSSELVYDRPGVYCRLYTCPECKVIFETFLDSKGNRLSNMDTWWRPAVANEVSGGTLPPGPQIEQPPAGPEKQLPQDVKAKPPEKPAVIAAAAAKPAAASGPPRNTPTAVPPQITAQPQRVGVLQIPLGGPPAAHKPAAPAPNKAENRANRGKSKKTVNYAEKPPL